MANRNGFVQRVPLPPLNSPTLTRADRTRVYGAIGKELDNISNGVRSYHDDSVKKSSKDLMSELNGFIHAVESLKDAVNDPEDIVGDAVRDLKGFKKAFETGVGNDIETMWNDSKDERDSRIKLPDSLAPTTDDNNIIYIDPESDGLFSAPNPLSPNQWPKDLKASTGSSGDVTASAVSPDMYPRPISNWFARLAGIGSQNPAQPAAPPLAPSVDTSFVGGLAGRIAALTGIDPQYPIKPALAQPNGAMRGLYRDGPVQPWFVQDRR